MGSSGRGEDGVLALSLTIDAGSGADGPETEEIARSLRAELLDRDDVEQVTPSATTAPAGAKFGDPVTWQTLLVTLSASGGVLAAVVSAIGQWLSRTRQPVLITVKLGDKELSLTDATESEREQLIAAFVEREHQD